MADVATTDINAAVSQAIEVAQCGACYMRYTAQGVTHAKALKTIREKLNEQGCHIPLVADIHFSPVAAFEALKHVEKVRINPGNFAEKRLPNGELTEDFLQEAHALVEEKFGAFVIEAKKRRKAIRIGVNHGSLSQRMLRLWGNTPEGMCQSALEYLSICRKHHFSDVVISMKSSNPLVMTEAVRLLVEKLDNEAMPVPLHLGVTEAGESEDGRIKSALGIGSLLADGIGDTIRVSLTEPPQAEIPVAESILKHIARRANAPTLTPLSNATYQRGLYHRDLLTVAPPFSGPGTTPPLWIQGGKRHTSPSPLTKGDLIIEQGTPLEEAFQDKFGNDYTLYHLDAETIAQAPLEEMAKDPGKKILLLTAKGPNRIGLFRQSLALLKSKNCTFPLVIGIEEPLPLEEEFIIEAAIDLGAILLEGAASGIYLHHPLLSVDRLQSIGLGILQAARLRFSRAEFISCPGCGRTLYHLQHTIGKIKDAFGHLSNIKIGVMGCIVNGPGEMADADYGYVGSSPGKIDLYKGSTCLIRGVAEENAVAALEQLIKQEGDWKDRPMAIRLEEKEEKKEPQKK